MRRQRLLAAIAALAMVATLGTATVAREPGSGGNHGKKPAPTFKVTAKPAEQGGPMRFKVKVIHGSRTVDVTATAVATLDGGDVEQALAQRGKQSRLYMGRTQISATETLGCKTVVITVTYGTDTPQVFTKAVPVVADGTDMETVEPCPAP